MNMRAGEGYFIIHTPRHITEAQMGREHSMHREMETSLRTWA